jgi:transposase
MSEINLVAIDLAKTSFQVCVVDSANQMSSNKALNRNNLETWLTKQKPSLVAMEACGSAHFWAKKARALGHNVMLIPPRFAKKFVQGHKTDYNDALAIAVAARQPNVKPVAVKSDELLALQGCQRVRQHYQDTLIATSNMIRGLLYEFGITFAKGNKAFSELIPYILEDGENGLPDILRGEIHRLYETYTELKKQLTEISQRQSQRVDSHKHCQRLKALEGVGEVNALGLLLALGENGEAFSNGRNASACIGMTPKQHSTGGKTVMLGIGKKSANKRLRANLIQGALAKAKVVAKREPKTTKEVWLKGLIERRGIRRAAVALANKTIRTAWAMLHYGSEYRESAPALA